MIVVLDNLRSALNVGSIIRTCDAFGIKEVFACGITPTATDPKVQKTSLGAERNVFFQQERRTIDAIEKLRARKFKIVSLELTPEAQNIGTLNSVDDFALVIGNEVSGVSENILKMSDRVVKIPMEGIKESLNVSVAFGIAAYALQANKRVDGTVREG